MEFVRIIILFVVLLMMVNSVSAVIDHSLTNKLNGCGNKERDGYELCEPGTDFNLCPQIGKLLKIAMVCYEKTCGCLPVKIVDCKNKVREGNEGCQEGIEDLCPEVEKIVGKPLKCNPQTCFCELREGLSLEEKTKELNEKEKKIISSEEENSEEETVVKVNEKHFSPTGAMIVNVQKQGLFTRLFSWIGSWFT